MHGRWIPNLFLRTYYLLLDYSKENKSLESAATVRDPTVIHAPAKSVNDTTGEILLGILAIHGLPVLAMLLSTVYHEHSGN
jgi:hypothetical protein